MTKNHHKHTSLYIFAILLVSAAIFPLANKFLSDETNTVPAVYAAIDTGDVFCETPPLTRPQAVTTSFGSGYSNNSGQQGTADIYIGHGPGSISGTIIQITFTGGMQFLGINSASLSNYQVLYNTYPIVILKRTTAFPPSEDTAGKLLRIDVKLGIGENSLKVKLSGPGNVNTDNDDCQLNTAVSVIPPRADIAVASISSNPTVPLAGQGLNFLVQFANTGLADLTAQGNYIDIALTQITFAGVQGNGVTDGGVVGGLRRIYLPDLAPGAVASFVLITNVSSSLLPGTVVGISGTMSTSTFEPSLPSFFRSNNTSSKTLALGAPNVDLAVICTSSGVFDAGNTVTYRLDYSNAGPMNSQDTQLSFSPSPYLTNYSFTPAPTMSVGGKFYRDLNQVNALTTGVVQVVAQVLPWTIGTSITQSCAISGVVNDANSSNNTNSITNLLSSPTADVALVSLTRSLLSFTSGDLITYTFNYINNGPRVASGALLVVNLLNQQLVSASGTVTLSGSNYVFSLGSLLYPMSPQQFLLTTRASGNDGSSSSLSGMIVSAISDLNTGNNVVLSSGALSTGVFDCALTRVQVDNTSPLTGEIINYIITYQNSGNRVANPAVISLSLSGLQFISSPNSFVLSGTKYLFAINQLLANGSSGSISFASKVVSTFGNSVGFSSSINCFGGSENNSGNNIIRDARSLAQQDSRSANLELTVSTLPDVVQTGNWVQYIFKYVNNGPATSADTTVKLDVGQGLYAIDSDKTYSFLTGQYIYSIGQLQPGEQGNIVITARTYQVAGLNAYVVRGLLTGSSPDINYLNNTATGSVTQLSPISNLYTKLSKICYGPLDTKYNTNYQDRKTISSNYRYEILALTNCDIFMGYKNRSTSVFLPGKSISRIEMIIALVRAITNGKPFYLSSYASRPTRFTDLGNNANVKNYVKAAESLGLLRSYSGTKLRWADFITPSEGASLVQIAYDIALSGRVSTGSITGVNQVYSQIFSAPDAMNSSGYLRRGAAAYAIYGFFKDLIGMNIGNNTRFLRQLLSQLARLTNQSNQIILIQRTIQTLNTMPDTEFESQGLVKNNLLEELRSILIK